MVDVVLSYCHNTLNDTSLAGMLPYFAERGVGVISASCTSMGLFTKQACCSSEVTGALHARSRGLVGSCGAEA